MPKQPSAILLTLLQASLLLLPACLDAGSKNAGAGSAETTNTEAGGLSPGNGNLALGGNTPALPVPNQPNVVGPAISPTQVAAIATLGGPNNAYTLVGRFDATLPTAIRFSLPNSKLGATFTGTSLAVSMAATGTDVYAVSVDGAAPVIITTAPGPAQVVYPVAPTLPDGNHTVWLIKRTEGGEQSQADPKIFTGGAIFGGFVLAPGATFGPAPAPRSHLIVALGDSSFTGYGVGQLISATSTCVYTPNTQDATLSVPGQLADLLNAEVINVSASGKGMVQSAYDLNNTANQLPALWQRTVPPNALPAYSFPPLDAEAIVVSAGSDDLVGPYGSGVITDPSLFVSTYTALLADMRLHYPKAIILALVNPNAIKTDRTNLQTLLAQVVANRNAGGDLQTFVFDYFAADPKGWQSYNDADSALGLGHGCQGHASPAGSLFLAQRLAAFLKLHPTPLASPAP